MAEAEAPPPPITIPQDPEIMEICKCVICLEKYNKSYRAPVSASCGHTFCKRCVNRVISFKTFSCCVCRRVTFLGSSDMSKNLTILTLLEKMGQLENDDDADIPLTIQVPMDPDAQDGFIVNATQEAKQYAEQYLSMIIDHFTMYEDTTGAGSQLFVGVFNNVQSLRYYHDHRMNVSGNYLAAWLIPQAEYDQTPVFQHDNERTLLNQCLGTSVEHMLTRQNWRIAFRAAVENRGEEREPFADDHEDEDGDNTVEEVIDEVLQNVEQQQQQQEEVFPVPPNSHEMPVQPAILNVESNPFLAAIVDALGLSSHTLPAEAPRTPNPTPAPMDLRPAIYYLQQQQEMIATQPIQQWRDALLPVVSAPLPAATYDMPSASTYVHPTQQAPIQSIPATTPTVAAPVPNEDPPYVPYGYYQAVTAPYHALASALQRAGLNHLGALPSVSDNFQAHAQLLSTYLPYVNVEDPTAPKRPRHE
uniref:RING-type domain-containing protein n=2 Tax=Panagrellus redivivus TaxID=6233 RepID=A0A7E4VU34_PANRE